MTAEWMLTTHELAEIVCDFIAGNESKPFPLERQVVDHLLPQLIAKAQAKKLLEYLIRKTVLGTGWIGTKEFESMLKQLEAK